MNGQVFDAGSVAGKKRLSKLKKNARSSFLDIRGSRRELYVLSVPLYLSLPFRGEG